MGLFGYYIKITSYLIKIFEKIPNCRVRLKFGELMDLSNLSVWSKTTLITSSVGETRVDSPSCKTGTFFLRYLALSEPIYRNFQSNGGKWGNLKLWILKIYEIHHILKCMNGTGFSYSMMEFAQNH